MDGEKAIIKAAKSGDITAVRKALAANPGLIIARDKDGSIPAGCRPPLPPLCQINEIT